MDKIHSKYKDFTLKISGENEEKMKKAQIGLDHYLLKNIIDLKPKTKFKKS